MSTPLNLTLRCTDSVSENRTVFELKADLPDAPHGARGIERTVYFTNCSREANPPKGSCTTVHVPTLRREDGTLVHSPAEAWPLIINRIRSAFEVLG